VASKAGGLNIKEYLQPRNRTPYGSRCTGIVWSRPCRYWGKADVLWEETGKSTIETAGVGGQASSERLAEITPGRAITQQGLVATCKDLLYRVQLKHQEGFGLAHESVRAMKKV